MELIHQSGRQAFYYGQSRESNPHSTDQQRAAWFAGYDEANIELDMWLDGPEAVASMNADEAFQASTRESQA